MATCHHCQAVYVHTIQDRTCHSRAICDACLATRYPEAWAQVLLKRIEKRTEKRTEKRRQKTMPTPATPPAELEPARSIQADLVTLWGSLHARRTLAALAAWVVALLVLVALTGCSSREREDLVGPSLVTAPAPVPVPTPIAVAPEFFTPPTLAPRPPAPAPAPAPIAIDCERFPFAGWNFYQVTEAGYIAILATPTWDEQPQDVPHIVVGVPIVQACLAPLIGTPAWNFAPSLIPPGGVDGHVDPANPFRYLVRAGSEGAATVCSLDRGYGVQCDLSEVPNDHGPVR